MMNTMTRRTLAALVLGAGIAASSTPAFAKDPAAPGRVDATVTIRARSAAVGVGYTWGDGVLNFHGRRYPFTVKGVDIAAVGYSTVIGTGRVYNLHRVSDFTGTYAASTGEATLVNGIGGQVLINGTGVQLRIDNVTKGAKLSGAADGIQLTLK
jgi:hypothetical protein